MRFSIHAATVWIAVSFVPSGDCFISHATTRITFISRATATARPARTIALLSKDKDDNIDDNALDFDDDDDDNDDDLDDYMSMDLNPGGTPSLGINMQLEPLTAAQAAELKREATDSINAAFDGRLEEIERMKDQVKKDFETSKKAMSFASDMRAADQTEKLMSKIDKLSGDFMEKNEVLRTGTKMAARADKNMAGQGMEVGSWGKVGGMNVLTNGGDGLLGSVSANKIEAGDTGEGTTESSIEVDTQVKGEQEKRIMIICDDKDKNFKKVVTRFEELLSEKFPNPVKIDTYNPASMIPMGGNNAQCCIVASTSLSNGQSSAENILSRVLKRTLASGGGVSKPPTHLVVISPVGTERIEVFPYSMQNMMGGKLKKAREVEETFISTVKGKYIADASVPSLDYTILKLGDIVDDEKIASGKDGVLKVLPGDSLDGKVGVEAAANTLLQAIILQPNARNATLSVVGAMGKNTAVEQEVWGDWFLRLDGPELWRSEVLVLGDEELERKFEELASYMEQWSDRFNRGAKGTGLTTPVSVVPSRFGKEKDAPNVLRKFGIRLEFKQTNTGAAYKTKSEEKELESNQPGNKSPNISLGQKREGGIEILVEEVKARGKYELRVRAKRCNMDDNTAVKEMSEETILKRLGEAVEVWNKQQ